MCEDKSGQDRDLDSRTRHPPSPARYLAALSPWNARRKFVGAFLIVPFNIFQAHKDANPRCVKTSAPKGTSAQLIQERAACGSRRNLFILQVWILFNNHLLHQV